MPSIGRAQRVARRRGDPEPLTTFVQQGTKLVGTGAVSGAEQGNAVAVSADGNTAIVGGYRDNAEAGAAWVWTRSGGVWTQQGLKLVGSGGVGVGRQGWSVALSADGNTAIVGGYADNNGVGAAWVWTRVGGMWSQEGTKLVGTGGVGATLYQGSSVALSADGNTALVGGYGDNTSIGATWVWTRSNGVWTQQGAKLVGTGVVMGSNCLQGTSVSLSANGNTALVGGEADNFLVGAAWVFTRSNGTWTQQGAKLVGSGAIGTSSHQGHAVALSTDGDTAMVGGYGDNSNLGAAWVFTRSGGVWTQQGSKLVGTGADGAARQGWSVSTNGHIAAIGGYADSLLAGGVWVWSRNGGVWSQQGPKLRGNDAVFEAEWGWSVAVSTDGHTVMFGGPTDNFPTHVGAAWVFTARTLLDFNGDGTTDRTVFRPSNGGWYSSLSGGGATATNWGVSTDVDVAADYDGDGKVDVAVFRPSIGTWLIVQSSTGTVRVDGWGVSGDIPIGGDVDGDAKADLVVYRPSAGAWFFKRSGGGTGSLGWGVSTDQPLLGDFDGDHKMDPTIYRSSNGVWYASLSSGGSQIVGWGTPSDIPVIGDFDGDGKSDQTIFRPGTGQWFVNKSTGGTLVVGWGMSGDIPVSGDFDGDGVSDFTVWRPSVGVWFTQFAAGGTAVVGWGTNGDKPLGRVPGS